MQDFFDAPPEGAVVESAAKMQFLTLAYKPMKTPENFAASVTAQLIAEARSKGRFGFSYYDREEKAVKPLENLSFVALGVVMAVSGVEKTASGDYVNWFGSRVMDTRTDSMAVWNGGEKPAFTGLYSEIKPHLPKGISATPYIVAYCLGLDRLIELPASSFVGREIQRGIAAADAKVSGKMRDYNRISIFALGSDDYLWGFSHAPNAFGRQTADGEPYAGKGDMYFAPQFNCGIVQAPKSPELHAKCSELQDEFRAYMNKRKEYQASVGTSSVDTSVNSTPTPININIRPSAAVSTMEVPAENAAHVGIPNGLNLGDDLPF